MDALKRRSRSREERRPVRLSRRVALLVVAALAILGLAQLLPHTGFGLAVRLAAAIVCVLVLPGALVQRWVGQPREAGVAIAGALVWSLGLIALGLALTFAFGRSLTLTLVVVAVAAAVALWPAARVELPVLPGGSLRPLGFVGLAGLLLGVAVWWASESIQGDGLFHTARMRKLDELPALDSVHALNEFRDGGLHPGYAFPVWHAALAMVARLADVDVSAVVQYGPALLVPFAMVVTYAAGAVLFSSWAGGVATVGAQLGLVAFSGGGVGSLELLSLPPAAARLLLIPALLALVFAYLREPQRRLLPSVALGALAIAIVHGSYLVYVCLLLLGYAAARLVTERREAGPDLQRVAAVFAAVLVPFAAFLAWLLPVLRQTASVRPDAAETMRAIERYGDILVTTGDTFRLTADTVVRGGATAVIAFLLLVTFALMARRRAAALVLGGVLAFLLVALVSPLFTEFSELLSLSQARRLPAFLPMAFAVGGGALLLARGRHLAVGLALALSVALVLVYPAAEGPGRSTGWAMWVGLAGALLALAFGRLLVRVPRVGTNVWAVFAAGALLLPVAVDGLRHLEKEPIDRRALPAGLIDAVRNDVAIDEVVFADLETSYRLAAAAPIPIAAGPPAHVAQTTPNRPFERRQDVIEFFYRPATEEAQRLQVLERYDADWLVVDRNRAFPEALISAWPNSFYDDGRYVLLRVPST